MYSDTLYHHGIKGQKWGVRRFQNPDGTLTEAGRKRLSRNIYKSTKKNSFTSKYLGDNADNPIIQYRNSVQSKWNEYQNLGRIHDKKAAEMWETLEKDKNLRAKVDALHEDKQRFEYTPEIEKEVLKEEQKLLSKNSYYVKNKKELDKIAKRMDSMEDDLADSLDEYVTNLVGTYKDKKVRDTTLEESVKEQLWQSIQEQHDKTLSSLEEEDLIKPMQIVYFPSEGGDNPFWSEWYDTYYNSRRKIYGARHEVY